MNTGLLPFRLSICGVPELCGFEADRVSHVLSILNPGQDEPEAFQRFAPHRRTTVRFHDIVLPAEGQTQPGRDDVARILEFGTDIGAARDVEHLLIHCMAGVSRSTAAAGILMAQANPGREQEAFLKILDIRQRAWPNSRMVQLADGLLNRRGALITALDAYYRAVLRRHDDMADYIRSLENRAHELPVD